MAKRSKPEPEELPQQQDETICPLCNRLLGGKVSRHHLIPKSRGGKFEDTVMLHQVCHSKIHDVFTERQLQRDYDTIAKLRAHDEIAKFVEWLSKKPPEFYTRGKKKKR